MEDPRSPVTPHQVVAFPNPQFAKAKLDKRRRPLPHCIGHRGYKARFPENTLLAYEQAIKAGADAIEADVHLTQDGVVVMSHDATLKRCFGRTKKLLDCTYGEIKGLRTLAPPHVSMPSLKDLLELLCEPGMEEAWLLLDVKRDNDPNDILRSIGLIINGAKAIPNKPWNKRILLGLWAVKYLAPAKKFLPGFPVANIAYEPSYARQFWNVPGVAFNVLAPMLMAPQGREFIRKTKETYHRQIFAWTVNSREKMQWCIRRQLDGIITDDPKILRQTCEEFDEYAKEPLFALSAWAYFDIISLYIFIKSVWWLFRRRLGPETIRRTSNHAEATSTAEMVDESNTRD